MADLLSALNPMHQRAVLHGDGPLLILAGAGSGKTRTLTHRVAHLIGERDVQPWRILAVTFTNKAAKEMMTRLVAMLPVNVRGMWIGTFHGLCNRFLRAHYKLANLPQSFQILDTQDQLSAVKRLMKQHNVDEERFPAKELQWFISGAKEEGLRPNALETRTEEGRRKAEIYQLYEEQCQREGVVDFAELMLRSYELLRDNDPIREHYALEVHGTRIGPLAFVGVPLEPFIELGLAVEARSPFPMTFVSGYTNGYRNYLPTEDEFARGGYEVDIAAFRPDAARIYIDTAADVLSDLSDPA